MKGRGPRAEGRGAGLVAEARPYSVVPRFDAGWLRLIAITDDLRDGIDGLVARSVAAVHGGATMVQVRLKGVEAHVVLDVTRAMMAAVRVPVIVNDRVDVALAAGASGAHLGADDLPVSAARRITAPGFLLGASVGLDAEIAGAHGADYVGIGPVFGTSSKDDAGSAIGVAEFMRLAARVGLPAVAIGGISADNVQQLRRSHAAGIAVIRGIFSAVDPCEAARALLID